jgi:hypothetical protein
MNNPGLCEDVATRAQLDRPAERTSESRQAPSSKYDYIKIRVWLGQHQEHYYVLSRFLISRMLTVTKLPQDKVRVCSGGHKP